MVRVCDFFSLTLGIFAAYISEGLSRKYLAPCSLLPNYEILRERHNIQQLTEPVFHGEGPHWDSEKQLLYFVDISGKRIHQYNPYSGQLTYADIGATVGAVIPVAGTSDKFVVGSGTNLSVATWSGENSSEIRIEEIHRIESDKPKNRFNDGKSDRVGRLWIGTMGEENERGVDPNQGKLYRFSNVSCKLEPVIYNVSISNGIAWSLDNRNMYFIDSLSGTVERFNYNINTGEISFRQTVINFKNENITGVPDGMTIDNKGNLWIACWNGSKVINVDPQTGKVIYIVPLPVERVTSVTFGGKNLDILYVTTMKKGLTPEQIEKQPAAGALFSISNLGVTGLQNSPAEIRNCIKT